MDNALKIAKGLDPAPLDMRYIAALSSNSNVQSIDRAS